MKSFFNIAAILLGALLLTSCEKEETPIKLPEKHADVKLLGVDLGKDYLNQIFVNLETGATSIVGFQSWDLAFDASKDGRDIFQNGGKDIRIANSGTTSFQSNPHTGGLQFKWDESSGKSDSLVLKNCIKNGNTTDTVYIINRGAGKEWFQFKIIAITDDEYVIDFADMAKTYVKRAHIIKDKRKANVYFSFDNGGEYLNFEPELTQWHICFLRYRWIYYEFNPPLRYVVTGVFINTKFTTAAVDSTASFYEIQAPNSIGLTFKNQRDAIGFDWKSPDLGNLTNVKYTIRKHVTYFVKENTTPNTLFKMRFLDFYNEQGVKGAPQFEVQRLN
jgi:hypothetical protein